MDIDPREFPIYGLSEAAGYLHIPLATLRSWTVGRKYRTRDGSASFEPLIQLPDPTEARLSFSNLVEAHVLRALRTRHDVSMRAVRQALSYAEGELAVQRLLLSEDLLTTAGDIFLERYGELINLDAGFPVRLFPFLTGDLASSSRLIVIDPRVPYGRPTIAHRGISTGAIVGRIDAGESLEEVGDDYDLKPDEIEAAVLYERAA